MSTDTRSLEESARIVRNTFLLERAMLLQRVRQSGVLELPDTVTLRFWDGQARGSTKSSPSIWHKVAAFARDHEVDPARLVKAVFDRLPDFDPPLPQELLRPQALHDLADYERDRYEDMVVQYRWYAIAFKHGLALLRKYNEGRDDRQIQREAIVTAAHDCTAIFAWCMATGFDHADIAEIFRARAQFDYLRDAEDLEKLLGTALTDEFRAGARRQQQALFAQFEDPAMDGE